MGGLDCHAITTEYISRRVYCIHM